MHFVRRSPLVAAALACGLLCTGCAGVIAPDINESMRLAAANQAAVAREAEQTALAMHMQALADTQRAADAMTQLAAQAAAQVMPPPNP